MENTPFMQQSLIAQKIMEDSGIGRLTHSHVTWLTQFTKSFFGTPYSVAIVYFTNKKKYIYLQPALTNPLTASEAEPLSEDLFNTMRTTNMTVTRAEQDLTTLLSLEGYKIKIVRDLPQSVRKSSHVKQLAT